MAGISMMFCVITGIGLTLMYFILPETDGLSLVDIEQHFSDDSKQITDRKIAKSITNLTRESVECGREFNPFKSKADSA